MRKRIIPILVLLLVFGTIAFGDEAITILFNANTINTTYSPLKTDGDFMLPISDVFNKIGIQYNIDSSDEIITAYHNNMFLKYDVGSRTYYLNGKSFNTSNAPFIAEDIIYLPLSTITEALNISSENDEEQNTLILNNYSIKIYKI